jgi:hypothetical protein
MFSRFLGSFLGNASALGLFWLIVSAGCTQDAPSTLPQEVRMLAQNHLAFSELLHASQGKLVPGATGSEFAYTSALSAPHLDVRVPRDAALPLVLSNQKVDTLGLRLRGARSVAPTSEDGQVVFRAVLDGADALVATTPYLLEYALLLREHRPALEFEITLPATVRSTQTRADGSIWFLDGNGALIYRVPAPLAIDASHTEHALQASWDAQQSVLRIQVPDSKKAIYPLLVDPAFEVAAWEKIASPPALTQTRLAFDEARKELLLFGGLGFNSTPTNEMWAFSGAVWRRVRTPMMPRPRRGHHFAYDPVRKLTVLFGGLSSEVGVLGETWLWDGIEWREQLSPARPQARSDGMISFDSARGKLLLVGGTNGIGSLDDIWSLDETGWAPLSNSDVGGSVELSAFGAMAELGSGVHYMFASSFSEGGSPAGLGLYRLTYPSATQVTWQAELCTTTCPPPRKDPVLVSDPVNQRLILSGGIGAEGLPLGDQWSWNGTIWKQLGKIERVTGFSASRGPGNRIFAFGGSATGESPSERFFEFRPEGARNASDDYQPSSRRFAAMAHDKKRKQTLLFGGERSPTSFADTWKLSGESWSLSAEAGGPSERVTRLVYSPEIEKVLLFGGGGPKNGLPLFPGVLPDPGLRHMTYDSARKQILLWGGVRGFALGDDTWTFDGKAWTSADPKVMPPGRLLAGFAFFPEINRTLLVGGATGVQAEDAIVKNAFAWDGKEWAPEVGPKSFEWRTGFELTYDELRRVLVLHGGSAAARYFGDTWIRSAQGWELASAPSAQPLRLAGYGSAYDGASKRVVMFGGATDKQPQGQGTYAFRLRGGECTTGADCAVGFCTDGVCCEQQSCGQCQTCAGADPGVCGPVLSGEDPDSCASENKQGCSSRGVCIAGRGATCSRNEDCAEGVCSDGICCNERCNGACQSCKASEKITGQDGVCGVAKIGSNPRKACGEAAQCNNVGVCASGATCADDKTLVSSNGERTNCAPYLCRGQSCVTSCNSIQDCVAPSVCSSAGKCQAAIESASDTSCAAGGATTGYALSLFCGLALVSRARRKRSARCGQSTQFG